jgi:hypothetical protein
MKTEDELYDIEKDHEAGFHFSQQSADCRKCHPPPHPLAIACQHGPEMCVACVAFQMDRMEQMRVKLVHVEAELAALKFPMPKGKR